MEGGLELGPRKYALVFGHQFEAFDPEWHVVEQLYQYQLSIE